MIPSSSAFLREMARKASKCGILESRGFGRESPELEIPRRNAKGDSHEDQNRNLDHRFSHSYRITG